MSLGACFVQMDREPNPSYRMFVSTRVRAPIYRLTEAVGARRGKECFSFSEKLVRTVTLLLAYQR